ncbi:related to cel1 protein precursor [Cephalotrichum gorgonifer]|uniref:lytic cellulose monooxygenase (C4-dehydrogenating) n=1 Tax=Cephalotrichum gorgonifer TaxID=2041049 RepID=A0AAE8MWT9_9PEZI|nr:related to cel1 protein precursor [Cephalotrichum gorgonifer]
MKLLSLLAAVGTTTAHTIFVSLEVDGTNHGVSNGVRTPTYDGPITDVSSSSLACNGPPNPTTPTSTVIDVRAGSTVTAIWRHTLDSGPGNVMDPSHLGPTLAYLKKVGDATSDAGPGDGWFKIQEDGFDGTTWGTSRVINNAGKHQIKIPECIEDGQYLLRAEMIALHGAGTYPGAQFYMECAQLNIVGGSGSGAPATHAIPGIYKGSDPGVQISIYYPPVTNYVIPGPKLFTC